MIDMRERSAFNVRTNIANEYSAIIKHGLDGHKQKFQNIGFGVRNILSHSVRIDRLLMSGQTLYVTQR